MPTTRGSSAREEELIDDLRTLAEKDGKALSTADLRAAIHAANGDGAMAASSLGLTQVAVLQCAKCKAFHPEELFTPKQLGHGDGRCCAMCTRREREEAGASNVGDASASSAEPAAVSDSEAPPPEVPLPAWGIEEQLPEAQVARRRDIYRGDVLELWLPKGTRSSERREWVARFASDGMFHSARIAYSTPYWIDNKKKGGWITVKAAAGGMLIQEGPPNRYLNKPDLDEETLPPRLRGAAPAAGHARSRDSYAAVARPTARGPSDRKVLLHVYAPADAKFVRVEEPKGVGSGTVELVQVLGCYWRTRNPLPCGPAGFQYRVCVGTPGRFWGERTEKSNETRSIPGRRFESPPVDNVIDFGDSHGTDDVTRADRAVLLVIALIQSAKTISDDAARRLSEILNTVVQVANANFSGAATTIMQSACSAPCSNSAWPGETCPRAS